MTATRRGTVEPGAVLDEHRAIRAAVEALLAHIRVPPASRRAQWVKRLAEDLDALAGLLRPHFAREEAGGMFEAIEAAEPGSARECARLRAQHGALLDRLSDLDRLLHGPGDDAKSLEALRHATRAFLAEISRHEAAENALLVRVMEGEEVAALD